ncbi:NfeD family protein [Niveispirillum sp.]|uniref:NfeD family protein n=1 Tax=Niveispirillum sp. TaxID=1917217 RepID=UPI001B70C61F|nr:NfeD family protein [Niveispirillum sp.]MBP7337599.1 NfeD family protein [Niveispirillum sp.]
MEGVRVLYWHWWGLALILAALEMFLPGAAFLWVGGAAAIVGLLTLLVDIGFAVQLVLFGVLAVLAWFLSRLVARRDPGDVHAGTLNRRGEQYVGQVLTLEAAIENGFGRARVGDTVWRVAGPADLPQGARVRVTGTDGALLRVEAA